MFALLAISSLLVNVVCWLIGGALVVKYIWYSMSFHDGWRHTGNHLGKVLVNVFYLGVDVGVVQFIKWLTGHVGTELLAVSGAIVAACWSIFVMVLRKKWINTGTILAMAEH